MTTILQIGDRVAFSRAFLDSLGFGEHQFHTAQSRGRIVAFETENLAVVDWGVGRASMVNVHNLCRPGSLAFVESRRRP